MNETSIERKHRMMVLDTCKQAGEIEVRASMDSAGAHPLDLMHAALGIGGEAGEIVDLLKKTVINGKVLSLVDLTKEMGDLEWYLSLLRSVTGIDRQVVLEMNIEKLRARYLDGYSDKASLKRVDLRTEEAFFEERTDQIDPDGESYTAFENSMAGEVFDNDPQVCNHPTLKWGGIAGYVCTLCGTPAAACQDEIS